MCVCCWCIPSYGSLTVHQKYHNYLFIHISLLWLSLLSRVWPRICFCLNYFGVVSLALPRICSHNLGEPFNTTTKTYTWYLFSISFLLSILFGNNRRTRDNNVVSRPLLKVKIRIETKKKEYTIVNCCLINTKSSWHWLNNAIWQMTVNPTTDWFELGLNWNSWQLIDSTDNTAQNGSSTVFTIGCVIVRFLINDNWTTDDWPSAN